MLMMHEPPFKHSYPGKWSDVIVCKSSVPYGHRFVLRIANPCSTHLAEW